MSPHRLGARPLKLFSASLFTLCLLLPLKSFGFPAVREYDENVVATNTIEFTAPGSSMSPAQFAATVALAYDRDQGGVLDGTAVSGLTGTAEFGVNQNRTIQFNVPTNWGVSSPSEGNPISKLNAWTTVNVTVPRRITFEFPNPVVGGPPGEHLAQMGITVLSSNVAAYGNVRGQADFSGGGAQILNANVPLGFGTHDTFFGFKAPAAQWITRLELEAAAGTRMWLDDLGFVTTAFEIPEPAALSTAAVALASLPGYRAARRRR
jgi:hypothetical protein